MTEGKKFLDTVPQKEALEFSRRNRKNKFRKGTSRPYVNHCMEVARILHKNGYSEDTVIAGLLHDAVEDSETTLEDIETKFGKEVSETVKWITEDRIAIPLWIERKLDYIKRISNAPEAAVAVSVADNLHTITEVFQDWLKVGDAIFLKFDSDREKQKWYYRSLTEIYFIRGLFFENRGIMKMSRSITKVLGKMGM